MLLEYAPHGPSRRVRPIHMSRTPEPGAITMYDGNSPFVYISEGLRHQGHVVDTRSGELYKAPKLEIMLVRVSESQSKYGTD